MNLAMTVPMHELPIIEGIRTADFLGNYMMAMQLLAIFQRLVTDRTEPVLLGKQLAVLSLG